MTEVYPHILKCSRFRNPTGTVCHIPHCIYRYISVIIASIISVNTSFKIEANVDTSDTWISMPSNELLTIGNGYLHKTFMPDSALTVFSIVTNRYSPKMTKHEKEEVVAALNGLWETYMFGYFDHSEASRILTRSFEICEEANIPLGRNYFNMGVMYQNMAEISGQSETLYKNAADYYKQAFLAAEQEHDSKLLVAVSANLVDIAKILRNPSIVAEEIEILKKDAQDMKFKDNWRLGFVLDLYKVLVAREKGEYKNAMSLLEKLQLYVPTEEDPEIVRYKVFSILYLAEIEEENGLLSEVTRHRQEALSICRKFDIKDGVLECLDLLAKQFESVDKEKSISYRNRYLNLKDSLLNYQQFASMKEMEMHRQLRNFDHKIAEMERKDRQRSMVMSISLVIVLAVLVLLLTIYTKNKKQKALIQVLYSKNRECLKAEEQHRLLQKERDREEFSSSVPMLQLSEASDLPIDSLSRLVNEKANTTKYKNSQLDNDNKEQIMRKIMAVMEESEDIFQPGFSATNLSELTGINYKYISQVINEKSGSNFNVFLNEFRVKRACLLIDSMEKSMPVTIEGIAHQVGFRSRNSFTAAFKKFTGLNPSEYIRANRSSPT